MKAAIYHEFGEANVLKYEDISDPEINDDEILVKVKSASINSLDIRLRSGKSPRPVDLPHVGGVDISGEIVDVGKNVEGMGVGTRVVVNPTVRLEKGFHVIGVNLYGGFAEYVKVPGENVVPIPDSLSFEDASTLPVCYVTGLYGLIDRGNLKSGETVLVHAAGSGTGSAAVQVAKINGAKVIATAGSDEKLEKAKELGADETINYNKSDFAEDIKSIASGGVDLIFDQVGASFWDKNIQSLKVKGRLLLVGVVGGGVIEKAGLGPIIMRDLDVLGVTMFNATNEHLKNVVDLMASGKVKSVIDRTFPLSEASEAQKLLENRAQFGKVVLNP